MIITRTQRAIEVCHPYLSGGGQYYLKISKIRGGVLTYNRELEQQARRGLDSKPIWHNTLLSPLLR